MPGGLNELQALSGSHIITYHRWNRFCLFAGRKKGRKKEGIAFLPVGPTRTGSASPSPMSAAILQRLSFASELSFLSMCFQGTWKGFLTFPIDECLYTYRLSWSQESPGQSVEALLDSVLLDLSGHALTCHWHATLAPSTISVHGRHWWGASPGAIHLGAWKPYLPNPFSLNALNKHRGTRMNYTVGVCYMFPYRD